MNYAPVLILTLNRYTHLVRCIESLLRCKYASETDLIVALDYPLIEEHWDGYRKIKEYLPIISGFRSVQIIERESNYGEIQNSLLSQEYVFSKYDRMIYTEDDNEFSINFLEYVNKGLDAFEGDNSVAAICSLGGILDIPEDYSPNFMYIRGFSAWGFATWKNRLGKQHYSSDELIALVKNKMAAGRIRKNSLYLYYKLLRDISRQNSITGDAAISLDLFENNRFCVYPVTSKVRNFGHDGSGIHGGYLPNSQYNQLELDSEVIFEYSDGASKDDPLITELIKEHNRRPILKKIRIGLSITLLKLKLKKLINYTK